MKPIRQTIHYVDDDCCMVKSSKGNIYPVDLNHYCKSINVGDTALVVKSNVSQEWLLVDVEPKYPKPLDISEFPKTQSNEFNWIAYGEYLKAIEDMKPSERVRFDEYLKAKWEGHQ